VANQERFGGCLLRLRAPVWKGIAPFELRLTTHLVRVRFPIVIVLLACLAANGCSVFHRKKKQEPAQTEQKAEPRRIGTVALVNDELHFALVDTGTLYQPPKGTALKTFANGRQTGVLTVSGERKPPFIAADVAQGTPAHGDDVVE
jgi:hypothetical protein